MRVYIKTTPLIFIRKLCPKYVENRDFRSYTASNVIQTVGQSTSVHSCGVELHERGKSTCVVIPLKRIRKTVLFTTCKAMLAL